mmetsp:Transcript_42319/g.99336  ORF Transcript_42319/g.99336 Transcript_42319/m.99336 type:complete len:220 (-) Transcript_42319:6516-7175(-)
MLCSSSTTFSTPSSAGRSNMVSIRACSMMERKPRAPVLRARALRAMAASAGLRISSSTPSISNSCWYCLTSAFLGSVRIWTSASSVNSPRVATTGRRPTSSGMRPNLMMSSGSHSRKTSPTFLSDLLFTVAPKPMPDFSLRFWMTFSRPSKAPPQMNRMLVVSICRKSWLGCLRPPCGGTDAIVPSTSLSSACCTPSPDTSRVIDGLSALREILSISSI